MSRLDGVRTLLLDSTFRPLKTLDWKRAIVLDLQDRIDVVEYYDEVIRTPSTEVLLPAVVRLRQYLRLHRRGATFSRKNLLIRDEHRCQYCGVEPGVRALTLDHVQPRSRGGGTTWENVVAACGPCNRRKAARTPQEAGMPLLRPPRRPIYLPHQHVVSGEDTPREWAAYLQRVG